jgi:hypothetical protein
MLYSEAPECKKRYLSAVFWRRPSWRGTGRKFPIRAFGKLIKQNVCFAFTTFEGGNAEFA